MTVLRNCMPPTELGVSFRALPQSYAKDLAPRADGCGSARAAATLAPLCVLAWKRKCLIN